MTFTALRTDYAKLLGDVEALNDDHSPAAIWRRAERATRANATKARQWKARALDLDPAPLHNAIALSGMAPVMFEERWHLAVAIRQPSPVGGLLDECEDVVLIDPAANRAHVMGDRSREHVGPTGEVERLTVTTDPKAWARAIALDRLEWFRSRQERRRALQAEPTWIGQPAAALLLTSPRRVRWSDFRAKIIDVPADMRRDVQRAVLDQARLPRIEGRA